MASPLRGITGNHAHLPSPSILPAAGRPRSRTPPMHQLGPRPLRSLRHPLLLLSPAGCCPLASSPPPTHAGANPDGSHRRRPRGPSPPPCSRLSPHSPRPPPPSPTSGFPLQSTSEATPRPTGSFSTPPRRPRRHRRHCRATTSSGSSSPSSSPKPTATVPRPVVSSSPSPPVCLDGFEPTATMHITPGIGMEIPIWAMARAGCQMDELVVINEQGHMHSACLHWDRLPRHLWELLSAAGYP
ncbi:hypothetical protein PVAP13_7NG121369 [Panicum virgatum]|uniref:Uncharacterized protein n=1 Tax=Panicum virgatum TaxID=38727 RepID=A0A8T0PTS9_PANVG|nr:hypothetical protein PVAP13_7NG121369 [Panicum virgatum]